MTGARASSSTARPGVRVGLDVGTVRIGVAASDPSGTLAMPVRTLPRARHPEPSADWPEGRASEGRVSEGLASDLAAVAALVGERDAVEVVIGLPRSLRGAEGSSAAAVRAYASEVARAIWPVPVRLVDERLSTVSAHRALHSAGRPGRRHRSVVDQAAAVTILQSALDAERNHGSPPGEPVGVDDGTPKNRGEGPA